LLTVGTAAGLEQVSAWFLAALFFATAADKAFHYDAFASALGTCSFLPLSLAPTDRSASRKMYPNAGRLAFSRRGANSEG
jgi:hypothetical protein